MNVDDYIDYLVTILLLALFIPITVSNMIPLYTQKIGGFDVQIEKTALKTQGEIIPYEKTFTSHNTMLMLAIADAYSADPDTLEINGTTIQIDETFLGNRISALHNAYNAMPTVEKMSVELYVDSNGPRKWVIKNE